MYRQQVEESFAPLPIIDVPLFGKEIVGQGALVELAAAVYGDSDPTAIHYHGRTVTTEATARGYLMRVRLPFTNKGEMVPGRALLSVLRNLPDEFIEHSRNARRDRLLALRSLMDALIVDALIEDAERPRHRRRSWEIDID